MFNFLSVSFCTCCSCFAHLTLLFSFLFFIFLTGAIPSEKPASHVPPEAEELSGPGSHKEGECPRLTCYPVPLVWLFHCRSFSFPFDPLSLVRDFPSAPERSHTRLLERTARDLALQNSKQCDFVRKERVVYLERPGLRNICPAEVSLNKTLNPWILPSPLWCRSVADGMLWPLVLKSDR